MLQTWRWFGPDDPVPLAHARQAGATGIVTALHHMNRGEAWTEAEIAKRKREVEAAGMTWEVVESIAVPEVIKRRTGDFRQRIDAYKSSIRAVGNAGIRTICYNFMAITDWTRTDLRWPLPNGGYALRFDAIDFCAYDVLILERPGAEGDYPPERVRDARARLKTWPESKIAEIERNLIDWVPARETVYDRRSFRRQLDTYRDLSVGGMRENLIGFLREIVPAAEEGDVRLAIHPDDPPFPLFGLPRVVSTASDARKILAAVDRPSNGLTLCTGSYGANSSNDLVAMANEFGPRIHFAHLRNTSREPDGSFYEAEHLDGDTDMVGVVAALLDEEDRRRVTGRRDATIPMRPDHGHLIADDIGKSVNPGIGRLKGLAELRGVMRTVEAFRHGSLR
jgi:mannonate dehydratase